MYSYKEVIVLVQINQAFITLLSFQQQREATQVAMPMKYQIQIFLHNKALCNIEIVQLQNTKEALHNILERFPKNEGYHAKVLVAETEKRILEVSREGIKVLSSIPEFQAL